MSLDYIKQHYGVPADLGRKVVFQGRTGVIVGYHGACLKVNFDDEKPNKYAKLHPNWHIEYGDIGVIRPLTRGQQRYQEWRDSENGLSFAEWCGMDAETVSKRKRFASERNWSETV